MLRVLALLPLLGGCRATPPSHPAHAAGGARRIVAEHGMVSSALPEASAAGIEMLRLGGNAVDAAVAAAFAVSVGEPQMSGLGGGGGMLVWLQGPQRAEYLDFYASGLPATYRERPGEGPLRGVALPGEVAGLLEAHERFGRLSRQQVLAPAIRLAEAGVPVGQVLARMIEADSARLRADPAARTVFWPDGAPLRPGQLLRQPALAATLRDVAAQGRASFYAGPLAARLVAELNRGGHPATLADLAAYAPRWKRPLCIAFRGRAVLSAPPPQNGMQVLEALRLVEHTAAAAHLPTRSAEAFDALASALRVAAADAHYNADPNWARVPAVGAVSEGFARRRAVEVGRGRAELKVEPGSPVPFDDAPPDPLCTPLDPYRGPPAGGGATEGRVAEVGPAGGETTHLSAVDAEGNAVSLTQTNSTPFGTGRYVAGFFLNDSGVDFSRNTPLSTGIDPWYTRRSTTAPTLLLRDGRVDLVVGAPGDDRIPGAIVQTILYSVVHDLDPFDAVAMPRLFVVPGSPAVEVESGYPASLLAALRVMGYLPTSSAGNPARVYLVMRDGERWIGVADPRHDGEPRGY